MKIYFTPFSGESKTGTVHRLFLFFYLEMAFSGKKDIFFIKKRAFC